MAAAATSMVLKLHTIAPSTADTEPITLAQPLAAHAHPTCAGSMPAAARIPIERRGVHVDEIARLSEAAISASSQGVVPIVRIDDTPIGHGRPGPLVSRLVAAYDAYVREHLETAC